MKRKKLQNQIKIPKVIFITQLQEIVIKCGFESIIAIGDPFNPLNEPYSSLSHEPLKK